MTEEEIKKLAEECALYYQGRPSNKGYELSNRLTIESYANMVLKWLSSKFCIVEKEKARELQQMVFDNQCSVDYNLIDGLSDWVEINLGSSLFEEDKK